MVVTYIELNMGSILGNEKTNFQHMHINKIIKQSPNNHQSNNESTVYHMYKSCTYIWSEMQNDVNLSNSMYIQLYIRFSPSWCVEQKTSQLICS